MLRHYADVSDGVSEEQKKEAAEDNSAAVKFVTGAATVDDSQSSAADADSDSASAADSDAGAAPGAGPGGKAAQVEHIRLIPG